MSHFPFPPLVAFLTTLVLLTLFLRSKSIVKIQDVPNHRSLHTHPIPRIGGLALIAGTIAGGLLVRDLPFPALYLVLGLLVGISLIDDVRGLSAAWRFLAHSIAAAAFLGWIVSPALPIWAILPLAICLIWMTNLFNFMDGSDGLAGGMATIGFVMYGLAALKASQHGLALFSFCVSAATLAFLLYNFNPAKVFLGDAGSIPLGFLAAGLGIHGWRQGLWPFWFPLLVFSPFIVDATVTLLKRIAYREQFWRPHNSHYYQRLIRSGWNHRKMALAEYALMTSTGGSALWGLDLPPFFQAILLVAWCLVYAVLGWRIDRHWLAHSAGAGVPLPPPGN